MVEGLCGVPQRLFSQMMRLPHYKLFFEDVRDNPKATASRVRGKLAHDQRMQFWKDIIKGGGKLIARLGKTGFSFLRSTIKRLGHVVFRLHLRGRFNKWYKKRPREFTIKIRWVIVFFALLHFWPSQHIVYAEPESVAPAPKTFNLKHIQPLDEHKYPEQPQVQPIVAKTPTGDYSGSHEDWMTAAGIDPSDYGYVDYIVSHESGWRVSAYNPSGAYGLCQSLPGSKMASAGADWETNPVTQLVWCNNYAMGRGGWAASYNFWLNHHWW